MNLLDDLIDIYPNCILMYTDLQIIAYLWKKICETSEFALFIKKYLFAECVDTVGEMKSVLPSPPPVSAVSDWGMYVTSAIENLNQITLLIAFTL